MTEHGSEMDNENAEALVQKSFSEWQNVFSDLINSIEHLGESINKAVNSHGKGYMALVQTEDWLNNIYEETYQKGSEVKDVLHEVQQVLLC